MNSCGFTDSITNLTGTSVACPRCGGEARLVNGSCVRCLLHEGLGEEAPPSARTELDAFLADIDVRDSDFRIGNYDILGEIGRGGMGVIYRARQTQSRRIVALKQVLGHHADSAETVARFRREAEAAASLDHPNILPIYEVGETDDGGPYFTMKLAAGGSLAEAKAVLADDPRHCVWLMAKVARAVHHAHKEGILHRDLKPGNILLDGWREPMVSDFGLAKWLDASSDLTRTLSIFGTPGYIAPEQAAGPSAQLKPAADIYSLGAILFDLLAGRPPFLGEHALAVIRQAAEKPAPRLRTLVRSIDKELEVICAKCLDREPKVRYQSAADLAVDLERWLEGRAIVARPIYAPVRVWRWSKRNPMLACSVTLAVILGVAGIVGVVKNSRLSAAMRTTESARHSLFITPFEDLDAVSKRSRVAQETSHQFTAALNATNGIHLLHPPAASSLPTDVWRADDWKRIGEAQGARMILSGSVRRRENKQRIAIHLIDTASGSTVANWLYDSGSAEEVAKRAREAIGRLLEGQVAPNDGSESLGGTTNLAARSYYERGKDFFFRYNLPDLDRAIESFRMAVRLDAAYARAQASLASACQMRSILDPEGKWLEEADGAAAKALQVAPMLAEAYDARAGSALYRGQVRASLDDYLTAHELEPGNSHVCARLANAYHVTGRADLAILWYEKASRRENRPFYADNIGNVWADLGEYKKAEEAYKTAAIFRPDIPVAEIGQSRIEQFRSEFDKARFRCRQACEKHKGNPQPLTMAAQIEFFSRNFAKAESLYSELMKANRAGDLGFYGSVRFLSAIGHIRNQSGAADGKALLQEALALDEKEVRAAPDNAARLYSLAADYAALGDADPSLTTLEKAIQSGWIDRGSMTLDPRFDAIRPTPRFQQAVERLEQTTREMRERINVQQQ